MAVLALLAVCLAVSGTCRLPDLVSSCTGSRCSCQGSNLEEEDASGTHCSGRKVQRFQSHGNDGDVFAKLQTSQIDENRFTQLELYLVNESTLPDASIRRTESVTTRTSFQPNGTSLLSTFRSLQSRSVLLSGSEQFQVEIIRQLETLSREDGLSSLVLNTKWLLVLDSHVVKHVSMTSMLLNNLLVLSRNHTSSLVTPLTLLRSSEGQSLVCITEPIVSGPATPPLLFPNEGAGLLGRKLRVGINSWYSYTIANRHNGTTVYTGFCIDLLNILAEALNFSYRLVLPPDEEWGDLQDGHWTGLVGLVERQEVDVVVAALNRLDSRKGVLDLTLLPFHSVPFGFAFVGANTPLPLSLWSSFLSPFGWQVYVFVAASFPSSLAFLWLVRRLELTAGGRHDDEKSAREVRPSVSNMAMLLFGAILNKAMTITGDRSASRMFFTSWCLLGVVLTACYTCKLTSLLVAAPLQPPFTSLAELVSQDVYTWGTISGSSMMLSLRTSNNSDRRMFYNKMMATAKDDPDVLSLDPENNLKKVLAGQYAYYIDRTAIEAWRARHCEIQSVYDESPDVEHYHIVTPKNSALTAMLDSVLIRLEDSGTLSYLRNKWFYHRPSCLDDQSAPRSISIATLQGPCYVAIAGILLAAGTLLVERALKRQRLIFCRD